MHRTIGTKFVTNELKMLMLSFWWLGGGGAEKAVSFLTAVANNTFTVYCAIV